MEQPTQRLYEPMPEVTESIRARFSRSPEFPVNTYASLDTDGPGDGSVRFAQSFNITKIAAEQASWDLVAQHAAITGRRFITNRVTRIVHALTSNESLPWLGFQSWDHLRRMMDAKTKDPSVVIGMPFEWLVASPKTIRHIWPDCDAPGFVLSEQTVKIVGGTSTEYIMPFGTAFGVSAGSIVLAMPIEMLAEKDIAPLPDDAPEYLKDCERYRLIEQYRIDINPSKIVRFTVEQP